MFPNITAGRIIIKNQLFYLLHLTTPYTRVSMMTHTFRHPQRSERGDLLSALRSHLHSHLCKSIYQFFIKTVRRARARRGRVVDGDVLALFGSVRRVCCTSHVTTR